MNSVEQSINPLVPPEKPASNNSKLIIVVLVISTILASLLAVFFYWQNTRLKNEIMNNLSLEETIELVNEENQVPIAT